MSRFISQGVAGDIFSADQPNGKTAVFCNGFPGAIGPLPGVLYALSRGFTILFPQYPGTYDSDGEFTVSASSEALQRVILEARAGKLVDVEDGSPIPQLDVDTAIGHSFGAFILANLLRGYPDVGLSQLLLLAPVLTYSQNPDHGTREELLSHIESVRVSRPRTYRISKAKEWKAIAQGDQPIDRMGKWTGRLLALIGSEDDTFDLDVLRQSFGKLVQSLVGTSEASLHIVEGAGHGMDELLAKTAVPDAFLSGSPN